jgi:hypothetical protein
MITSKILALEKQVSKAIPGFAIKKTLMIMPPVERLVRGINFDRSAYDEMSFSVTAFVMPLCVPAKHFGFTFGEAIRHSGGGDRWSTDLPNLETQLVAALKRQAMPFLSKGETLGGFIEIAKAAPQTGRTLEGLGYAVARSGDAKQAIEILNRLVPMLNLNSAWQRELVSQVQALSTKLAEHPEEAREQLAQWEEETVRNLGLEEFREVS